MLSICQPSLSRHPNKVVGRRAPQRILYGYRPYLFVNFCNGCVSRDGPDHFYIGMLPSDVVLPAACDAVRLRASGGSRDDDPASRGDGKAGGSWSLCTHLRSYGLNVDFGVLSVLLALQPRTSLELGCGAGLYSSWLNIMAGTSPAVGVEPKPLMLPLMRAQGGALARSGLTQLVANMVNATGTAAECDAALPKFDVRLT